MENMKRVYRDNIPCWYALSWQKTPKPAVILQLHKDFIKTSQILTDDSPIIKAYRKEFEFSNFCGNFGKGFGFDGSFTRDGEIGEFAKLVVEIPQVRRYTNEDCFECDGSGRKDSDKCLICSGKGKRYNIDWKRVFAISASFSVLTTLLMLSEKETSSSLLQLMTVQTGTSKGPHGGSLGGEFSVPLCNWMDSLRMKGKADIREMIEAMKLSYNVMFGLTKYEEYLFRANVAYEGGWLNTSCPGDACGLNPNHMGPEKGKGYEFGCHNVDTPMQQLVLIASLAALHDKVRKEIMP